MRQTILLLLLTAGLVVLAPWPALAQIQNPSAVLWDHADFASASRYDGGYFALLVKADNTCDLVSPAATTPTKVDNLGKPATTTGVGMAGTLQARPIGCYVYKVRALDASGLYSDWSSPSDPFERTPATPGKPVVK